MLPEWTRRTHAHARCTEPPPHATMAATLLLVPGRGNITFPNSRLAQSSRPFLASRNLCPQHETAVR
jgi:hypothetical protein